jgi:O-antigen/teichoic acid export membrane protein
MARTSRRANLPPDVDYAPPPADLTGTVVSGVIWKATTRGVALVTRVATVVVLARLLTPTDYGVAGMAIVVASFAAILTDPALGAALVQRPAIDERDRSTVFWSAAGIGCALTVLGIAASPLVADFFGEPEVRDLFAVTSLCFVVIGLSVAHRALLLRRLAYRSLEIREMLSLVTGAIVAVAVALAGFGPWAVIWNFVAYCVMSTVLVWILLDWRPRFTFSVESLRKLGGFSLRIFSATTLSWGTSNLDKVLIGRVLTAAALGAYSLASNIAQMPLSLVSGTLSRAVSPAYSRIQDDKDRLERAWLRNKRMSVSVVAPMLATLVVAAPDFVQLVFGEKWDDTVAPLRLLCVASLAQSLGALNWSVLQARGEGGAVLRLILLTSCASLLAFVVGLTWGIVGVATSYAIARWLIVVPTTWLTTRTLSFDFWAGLRAGAGIVPIVAVAAAIGFGAQELLLASGLPLGVRLVLVGSATVVSYAAFLFVFARSLVVDAWQLVTRYRTRRD